MASRTTAAQVQGAADDVARLMGASHAMVTRGSKTNGVAWSVRFGGSRRVKTLGFTAGDAWNRLDAMRDALYAAEEFRKDRLQEFVVDVDPDKYAGRDPGILHTVCGEMVCTAETDDSLDLLERVATGHECDKEEDE